MIGEKPVSPPNLENPAIALTEKNKQTGQVYDYASMTLDDLGQAFGCQGGHNLVSTLDPITREGKLKDHKPEKSTANLATESKSSDRKLAMKQGG